MNWSGTKTLLICLFALLNLFLFSYVIYMEVNEGYLKKESLEKITTLLAQHNMTLQDDALSRWIPKMNSYQLGNTVSKDWKLLSDGNQEKQAETTQQVMETETVSGSIDQNKMTLQMKQALEPDACYQKQIGDLCLQFLKSQGFSVHDAFVSHVAYEKEQTKVTIHQKLGQYEVLENKLELTVKKNGTMDIEGIWFGKVEQKFKASRIYSPVHILITFMNEIKDTYESVQITAVKPVYSIGGVETYYRNTSALPCWLVEAEADGETIRRVYDGLK